MNTVAIRDTFFEVFMYGGAVVVGYFVPSLYWPLMLLSMVAVAGLYMRFLYQNQIAALATIFLPILFIIGVILRILYVIIRH